MPLNITTSCLQIFLGRLGWLMGVVPIRPSSNKQATNGSTASRTGDGSNPMLGDKEKQSATATALPEAPPAKPNHQAEWQLIVKVMDRIMFLVFLIVVIICVGIFFPRPK